jgi:hypothetical protein
MDIYHNLIDGCRLCKVFLDYDNSISNKLIYPENKDDINNKDFIIIKCNNNNLLIVRDHISSISKELWGKILFNCKNIYGKDTKLSIIKSKYEHWYAIIDGDD